MYVKVLNFRKLYNVDGVRFFSSQTMGWFLAIFCPPTNPYAGVTTAC